MRPTRLRLINTGNFSGWANFHTDTVCCQFEGNCCISITITDMACHRG